MTGERQRKHGADVIADRVEFATEKWFRFLEPAELSAAEQIVAALREIAAGERIGRRR